MNTEFDYDLTRDQWEALKALRLPAAERRIRDRLTASLIALQLAAMTGDGPVDHTERPQRAAARFAAVVGPGGMNGRFSSE